MILYANNVQRFLHLQNKHLILALILRAFQFHKENRQRLDEQAETGCNQLTPELMRCVELSKEKGPSLCLSVLTLEEHVFYLHKGEFRDAPCHKQHSSELYNCASHNHAIICHMGRFSNNPSQRNLWHHSFTPK